MNAIIYSRVSTLDQDNRRAIDELKDYAKYKKYHVVKVFEEKISGAIKAKERGEFAKVLDYISKNKVDHLLVWELSRLGRSMVDVINTIESLSEKKINVYCKKENIYTLDEKGNKQIMTNIIISVLSGFAEMERETIRARSKSGIRANVARGGIGTGGVKPYGYKPDNGMLVVDPDEAEVVKEIYTKYLNGLGTQQIANYLNNQGILTRYNKEYQGKELTTRFGLKKKAEDYVWRDATIYSILTNSIYYGERKHKGEIFKVDSIIEKSAFDRVQDMLSKRYNKSNSTVRFYNPLEGLLICGKCGRSYFLHKRSPKKDGKRAGQVLDNAYKCLSKRLSEKEYGDKYCGSPSVNYDKLIDSIYIAVQNLINSDLIDKGDQMKSAIEKNIENKTIERDNALQEISDLEKQSENLIRLNIKGKMNEKQFTKLNSELIDKLAILNSSVVALNIELDKLEKRKEPKSDFDYTKESLGAYLKEAVEYIKVYGVDVEKFRDVYPSQQEALILIQIKANLEWEDGSPIYYHYLISRRSNVISFIDLEVNNKIQKNIDKSNFKIDFSIPLTELKPLKSIKNYLLKKKGEPYIAPPDYALKPVFEKRRKK